MNYNSKISFSFSNISKEQLLELEKFILNTLNAEDIRSEIILYCGHRDMKGNSIVEILKTEEISKNFNELTSIWGHYINNSNDDKISLNVFNKAELKKIEIGISSHTESFSIGNKQIFEDYLKKLFYIVEKEPTSDEIKILKEKESSIAFCKSCEPLNEYIKACNLSFKDLKEIELLILQDLQIDYEYKLLLNALDNHSKNNPVAKSYTFYSVDELLKNTDITDEIELYNISFKLYSKDVCVDVILEQENKYNYSKIHTSGKNQTLYYGKMMLLQNFFKYKRAWYWLFYTDLIWYLGFASLIFISALLGHVVYFIINKHILLWKYIGLIVLYSVLIILFRRAFPKIKIQNSKKTNWIYDRTIQFYITCLLSVISIIVSLYH